MNVPSYPHFQEDGLAGALANLWQYTVAPDGTRDPWKSAPVGSLYWHKASTSVSTLYCKMANNSADADWVVVVSTGASTGFLPIPLTDWHKVVSNDLGERVYNKVATRVNIPLESLREVNSNDIPAISDTPLSSDPAGFGGLLATNTTPALEYVNGDTDSELRVLWASSNNDPVVFQLGLPSDLDASMDMTLSLRGVAGHASDTDGFSLDTYFDTGDTKVSDDTTGFSTSEGTLTATIAAADIPSGARTMTVELTPDAHTNGTIAIYWIELLYYRSSTDPSLAYANGDTDSGLVMTWAASEVTPIVAQVPLPPDFDTSSDLVFHFRGDSGATDTPTFTSDTYFNEGDTKVSDTSTALGAAYAEETITIAAADIPSGAQTVTIELTPGTHSNDAVAISSTWFEYTRA